MNAEAANAEAEVRERLRGAVARVLDVFVAHEGTLEELNAWADIAEEYAARIEKLPPESVFWGFATRGVMSVTGLPGMVEARPQMADTGDRAEALVTYGPEHEGHPGWVHGGVLAATFDELFGLFQTFSLPRVVTAELTVRFLSPVPVGETVRFEAEIAEREGRKMRVRGTGSVDGATCVASEALFVVTRDPGGA
ncbi:MAG: PaaI family thioesterase [Dehalococcoidia bacterium]